MEYTNLRENWTDIEIWNRNMKEWRARAVYTVFTILLTLITWDLIEKQEITEKKVCWNRRLRHTCTLVLFHANFMQSLSVFFCFCFCFFGDSFLFFLFYLVNVSREGRVFEVVLTVRGQMTYLGEERVVRGRELEVGRDYTEL